ERIAEQSFGERLQIQIDVGLQRLCTDWWDVGARASTADDSISRIDFHELHALTPPELFLVLLLQSRFADLLAGLVALGAQRRELSFADLGDIPSESADSLACWIDAL